MEQIQEHLTDEVPMGGILLRSGAHAGKRILFSLANSDDLDTLVKMCADIDGSAHSIGSYIKVPDEAFRRSADGTDFRAFTVVARVGDDIAGFFIFERLDLDNHGVATAVGIDDDTAKMIWSAYNVGVLPEYRGLRLMQRMLEIGEGESVLRGSIGFVAKTAPDNLPSRRVFEASGYIPVTEAELGGRYNGAVRTIFRKDIVHAI